MHKHVIVNRTARLKIVERWKQTKEFVIRDKGRWGPAWLHKLVLRAATNLGMVGHMAIYDEQCTVVSRRIDVRDKSMGEQIFRLSQPFIDSGYRPQELIILCGPDWLDELRKSLVRELRFVAEVYIGGVRGDTRARYYGFPVVVLDHLDGAIVVPERALRP